MEITNLFYMIKKWTISDYKTPGIKAEVILDMLISDFVSDLLKFEWGKNVTLLTKELPIEIKEGSKLNAKVDYLVCAGETELVMVELKTTKKSYSDPQEKLMKANAKKSAAELIKFYKKIATLDSLSQSAKTKYKYSLEIYEKRLNNSGLNEAEFSAVDYMYILLTDNEDIKDKKLVLTDYCKGGRKFEVFMRSLSETRRELWGQVSEILLGCAISFELERIRQDALGKSRGTKINEKFPELIRFLCELNDFARSEGLLAVAEIPVPKELPLSEEIREARELFVKTASAEELTRLLVERYRAKKFQGRNALLYYITILAFVNLGRKSPDEFKELLLSCLDDKNTPSDTTL